MLQEGIFQRQGTQSIENGFNPIWVGPCDLISLGCNWASDLVANQKMVFYFWFHILPSVLLWSVTSL